METIALGSWRQLRAEIDAFSAKVRGLTEHSHWGTLANAGHTAIESLDDTADGPDRLGVTSG